MLLTTQNNLEGYAVVETIGIVQGNTVRARNIGRDIVAGFKKLRGGEISEYTELLMEARREALARMEKEATRLGADAIVAVRFETSDIMQAAAELYVYGTAVKLKQL